MTSNDHSAPVEKELLENSLQELAAQILDDDQPTAAKRAACLQKLLGKDVCRRLGIYSIPDDFVLSVVIPVFNEAATIDDLVAQRSQHGTTSGADPGR